MKFILSAVLLSASLFLAPFHVFGVVHEVRNYQELVDALAIARGNGENDTIRIYQGFYSGNFDYQEGTSEEGKVTILWGGYSDEEDPSDDPSKTILDAHYSGTVLYCNIRGTLIIRNLTFQNGRDGYAAGGLFVNIHTGEKPGTALIMNNIFQNNTAANEGGGLNVQAVNPDGKAGNIWLLSNTITGNNATGSSGGGGAWLYVNARSISNMTGQVIALGNTITENVSGGPGGGLHVWARSDNGPTGKVTVKGNTVIGNRAESTGYGVHGGGIYVFAESRAENQQDAYAKSINRIDIEDNTIQGNTVIGFPDSSSGGGAYVHSSSVTAAAAAISVKRNVVSENSVPNSGGGMDVRSHSQWARSGDVVLNRNMVSNNNTITQAGGVRVVSTSTSGPTGKTILTNNFIVENTSDYSGGLLATGKVYLTNNTIARNEAITWVGGAGFAADGPVNVYNNIIWGNTSPRAADIMLLCAGTYNGFYNDYDDMEGGWTASNGNIHENPRFIGNGNYHLQFSSPCRNAGTTGAPHLPSTDYDGQNRVLGGTPEMGADELLDLYRVKYLQVKWPLRLQNLVKRVKKD